VKASRKPVQTAGRLAVALLSAGLLTCPTLAGEAPATQPVAAVPTQLTGRKVDEVRILGKIKAIDSETMSIILRQVRTREGEAFEPTTVQGDYQRIYELRRFSNVEARVEPTQTGVIVVFEVSEQPVIKEIRVRGNEELKTDAILQVVTLKPGEAMDSFRLGLAKESIVRLYQSKNLPYVHVEVDQEQMRNTGVVTFEVIEGPKVRVRKVRFLGNQTYSDGRLKDQIKTKSWFPIFVSGLYDPDQVDQDIAAVREYYEHRGFFDVRVGRRVVVSPDQREVMVEFVIDEGPRYSVDKVTFKGVTAVTEAQLSQNMKLKEGMFYDFDLTRRDIRQMVKVYSPLGYVYLPADPIPDPDFLRIREDRVFYRDAGKVELIYDVSEGKAVRVGRILLKGNDRTQDKVVERELRVAPGELYNSDQLLKAQDRLKATGLYQNVTVSPIPPVGAPPEAGSDVRDLLVEVTEADTARFLVGAGISSNSGIMGQISYEQKNFDIANWPSGTRELFSRKAFTGAGQTFRISVEPGTEVMRARIDFVEPYVFDQPYSFGNSIYLSDRRREDWDENRLGDRVWLGHRFTDIWSARVFLRGEQVEVRNIYDKEERAPEILLLNKTNSITSVGLEVRRDDVDSVILPSKGTNVYLGWEHAGALGGDFDFDRFTGGFAAYTTVYEDLLDRKTILSLHTDWGYISGDAPFFERFYGGGLGSVRGFRYRGISPRSGIAEDPIGGDFMATANLEMSFPLAADILRGVLFTDIGDVEDSFRFGTVRVSSGFGFRLTLPFLSQLPIALDFGIPIIMDDQDDRRVFSFSLGTVQ
jgi:outer membrane protein insertion porin family